MPPSPRLRTVFTTFACLGALALGGCNALLDNRPADINGDLFATEPADGADAARGAGRDVDASVPDPGEPDPALGPGPAADGGPDVPADAARDAAADAAPQCSAGWADCNHLAADGCEADLSSPTSCGACGATCPDAPHATAACVLGACAIDCDPDFGDCNGSPEDGCEAQLMKDKHNCGACGQLCLLGHCEGGACVLKP